MSITHCRFNNKNNIKNIDESFNFDKQDRHALVEKTQYDLG